MYTKLTEDFNKNAKLFWSAFDVYTSTVKDYVTAEQKNRTALSDTTLKYFKQALEVKSPEKLVELQIQSSKELSGTVQKIVDENIEFTKAAGEKYSGVFENLVKETVKQAK